MPARKKPEKNNPGAKKTAAKKKTAIKKEADKTVPADSSQGSVKKRKTTKTTKKNKAAQLHYPEEMPISEKEMELLFAVDDSNEDSESSSAGLQKARSKKIKKGVPNSQVNSQRKVSKFQKSTGIISVLAFSILLVYCLPGLLWQKSVLPENGEIVLPGIENQIEVRRDSLGIPYIEAQNLHDLYFGTGYTMASDRLWQMYFLKLVTNGRLAEHLGEKFLSMDIYMRSVGIRRYGIKNYEKLSSDYKKLLQSFANGVNKFIETAPGLPPEFMLIGIKPEPWQPEDSILIFEFFNFSLSTNLFEELSWLAMAANLGWEKAAWLVPVYPDEEIPVAEAEKLKTLDWSKIQYQARQYASNISIIEQVMRISVPASNNWAVSGQKTSSGKSLLANDTHLQLSVPSAWYVMQQSAPGYRAGGVTLPGIPIVALGTNGKIAWGATMVMADNQDIFIEQLKTENGKTFYRDGSAWIPLFSIEETYKIKGKPEIKKDIRFTRNGPLLNDAFEYEVVVPLQPPALESEYGFALRSALADGSDASFAFQSLPSAQSATEVKEILSKLTGISLNMVYADDQNIGWQVTGKYPLRKNSTGLLPVIGWSREFDWLGYLPYSEYPAEFNPERGFVASANHKTVTGNTPKISSSWFAPERFERIFEFLSREKKFDREDMISLQKDSISMLAVKLQKSFFVAGNRNQLEADIDLLPSQEKKLAAEKALSVLQNWDGSMDKNSCSAAVFAVFLDNFTILTFKDELSEESGLWKIFQSVNLRSYSAPHDHLLQREDSPFWSYQGEQKTKFEIIALSLAATTGELEEKFGKDASKWKWGNLHKYFWNHDIAKKVPLFKSLLSRGPYMAGGSMNTVNVAGHIWGGERNVWLIPAMRFLVDFSEKEPAAIVTHMGNSGNALSDHYDDMIPYFLEVKNHPLPMQKENIIAQYNKIYRLLPENE